MGRDVRPEDVCDRAGTVGDCVRLLDGAGDLIGVAATNDHTGLLHPFVVLV
jgi:hypothetical protein